MRDLSTPKQKKKKDFIKKEILFSPKKETIAALMLFARACHVDIKNAGITSLTFS